MIQAHLYTRNTGTCIFNRPADDSTPLIKMQMGNWLGVLEYMDEWIRVLTIAGEGWVKAEETEKRPHFQLHARWNKGGTPEYINIQVTEDEGETFGKN